MTVIALFLIAVGLTDAARGRSDMGLAPTNRRWPAVALGLLVLIVGALLTSAGGAGAVVQLVIAAVALLGWVLLEDQSRTMQRHHAVPLSVLAAALALLIGLSGWVRVTPDNPLASWLHGLPLTSLNTVNADRFLLLLGLTLVQLSTGNRLVRLVLGSVGALRATSNADPQASDRLKGGRLLGPMERIFILGLGLAGQVTAAGIVIAAKGLIRWPELQATKDDERVGVDEVTEYFLVGSFTSWLLAMASLWLAH